MDLTFFPPRLLSRVAVLFFFAGAAATLGFDHPIVNRVGYWWMGFGFGIWFTMSVLFIKRRPR